MSIMFNSVLNNMSDEIKTTAEKETHNPLPAGCEVLRLKECSDERGALTIAEQTDLPMNIERAFWIYSVAAGKTRGGHAHRTCSELLVAVAGTFKVEVTDGVNCQTVVLDTPNKALYIPPYAWCRLFDFSLGSVCLCLASEKYDATGYINDFDEYKKEVHAS